MNFLPSVLPISAEVNEILLRTLDINWRNRTSITELRRAIKGVSTFYADDVVFEGSMARCSWEAGIDITGGSQPEDDGFDLPQHEEQQQEPGSAWSTDSSTDMVFAAPSRGDSSEWVPYPASGATWGDSDLRTDTPSEGSGSASFLTYDDQRTPSSSCSRYSPALSGPYISTQGDEESTFVDSAERLKPQALSVSTTGDFYEESIIMRSDSTTMHTAFESPVAYSSFFLSSSVSVAKPSYAAPSAYEVGISTAYDEDEEPSRDSMSWTRASTYDHRLNTDPDLINVSSMDFSPTEQAHPMVGLSPVSGKPWQDFLGVAPPITQPQVQAQGARLPFPLTAFKSSPATTTPFQSPPSPHATSRRKPRSSSFFNPIKFAFPPRHPSSAPPVPQRRSASGNLHIFSPLPHRKSTCAELAQQSSPVQEHSRGRRRHRQTLRTARGWFSGKLFAAAA